MRISFRFCSFAFSIISFLSLFGVHFSFYSPFSFLCLLHLLFVCLFVCLFLLCLYLYRALFTLAPVPAVESLLEDVDGAVTSLLLVVQRLSKATECENENREMQTEDPGCSSGKNNCVCVGVWRVGGIVSVNPSFPRVTTHPTTHHR